MDRLILLLALGCSGSAQPADAPAPSPAPATIDPAAPESAMEMPQGCCILQVTVAETGYVLRLWDDGHATEAWPGVAEATRRPFDTSLFHDEVRARFAERQRAAWALLVSAHDGTTVGPLVAEGTPLPGGESAEVQTIVFRTRSDGATTSAVVRGDLRVPSSLGPFAPAWSDLREVLWGPRR